MSLPVPVGYECPTDCDTSCAGLEDCEACSSTCTALYDYGGPGGGVADVFLCLLPIIFLLVVTLKPRPWSSTLSLPVSAAIMFCVRTMYLGLDPLQTSAAAIQGLFEAITPMSIAAGAIFLFESMASSGCLPWMMREMKILSKGHPVAEVFLIGWCFAYMIEGASGFGTPVALAAPMLASLGHGKFESVVCLLLMNMLSTQFGAVGTPIWYGFGGLGLSDDQLLEVAFDAAVVMGIIALVIVPLIAGFLMPRAVVRRNVVFIYLSIASCVGPSVGLSTSSFEFPSIMGGMIGCACTMVLIHFNIGLSPLLPPAAAAAAFEKQSASAGAASAGAASAGAASAGAAAAGPFGPSGSVIADEDGSVAPLEVASISYIPDRDDPPLVFADGRRYQGSSFAGSLRSGPSHGFSGSHVGGGHGGGHEPRMAAVSGGSAAAAAATPAKNGGDATPVYAPVAAVVGTEDAKEVDANFMEVGGGSGAGGRVEVAAEPSFRAQMEQRLGPRPVGAAYCKAALLRTLPLWGTVLILILTRIPQIGLKDVLTRQTPAWDVSLQSFADFSLSASLVIQLQSILSSAGVNWKFETLYVPSIIPFLLMSVVTLTVYRRELTVAPAEIARSVAQRMVAPAKALLGALVLVSLIRVGGNGSPAYILGEQLSAWLQEGWVAFAPFVGALGSFFSGSTTVSNLTFGGVQEVAAENIGVNVEAMLALQVCGASIGNSVCINNIVSACAVMGLTHLSEGLFMKRTAPIMVLSCVLAIVVVLAFFMRF